MKAPNIQPYHRSLIEAFKDPSKGTPIEAFKDPFKGTPVLIINFDRTEAGA